MYVSSHKPSHQDHWSKDCGAARDGQFTRDIVKSKTDKNASANTMDAPSNSSSTSLALNDRLKQVLMTNVCLSAENVDRLFQEAQEN